MKIVYGYQKVGDRICIKQSEALVVLLIYIMYLGGNSLRKISDELYSRGIKSPSGNDRWSAQYIDNVLSSRKYIDIVSFEKFVDVCFEKDRRSRKVFTYMEYRNHGQFELTASAILFDCLVVTRTVFTD